MPRLQLYTITLFLLLSTVFAGPLTGLTSVNDINAYLNAHNTVRAKHGAAALTWSDDLASKAQQWVKGCAFKHSEGPYGGLFSRK